MESYEKTWNLERPFSRPGRSWKVTEVMESRAKVLENDAVFNGVFTTALSNSVQVTQMNRSVNTICK